MKRELKLLVLLCFVACLATFYGCKKDITPESLNNRIPTLTMSPEAMYWVTKSAAETGGNIINDGGAEVFARGICWSRSEFPTTDDERTVDGTGTGHFTSNLTNLIPGTYYFLRAYATNSAGTAYGTQLSFTTTLEGDFPGGRRYGAASFTIGTKVYIGLDGGEWRVDDFWEWDQTTNIWSRKANFPGKQTGNATGFSIGTKGYIGFGYDPWEILPRYPNIIEFWEYDPSKNIWTEKSSPPPTLPGSFDVSFTIGTKLYIGLGNNSGLLSKDFWEWDQETDIWTKKADFGGIARSGTVGFSIGNKGYVGTGTVGGNTLYKDFWEWDQETNVWTQKADFEGLARSEAVGFSIGNKGYIGIGTGGGNTLYRDFWEWDQATDVWTMKTDFGGIARNSAIGFSIGNKGYIGPGYEALDLWEWDQATNVWTK